MVGGRTVDFQLKKTLAENIGFCIMIILRLIFFNVSCHRKFIFCNRKFIFLWKKEYFLSQEIDFLSQKIYFLSQEIYFLSQEIVTNDMTQRKYSVKGSIYWWTLSPERTCSDLTQPWRPFWTFFTNEKDFHHLKQIFW